jgi:large subunit ribosomal protein L3
MIQPIVNSLFAKKVGMSRMLIEDKWIGVTLLWAPIMTVVNRKTYVSSGTERDVVQVGFDPCRNNVLAKPQRAELEARQLSAFRMRRELTCNKILESGAEINPGDVCEVGQELSVTARTIGRGTTGVMKRHNFGGGRASHGTSKAHRQMGSTGYGNTSPARVFKNKKMPGHYGNESVTHHGLRVVAIDQHNQIIALRGSVPGKQGWVKLFHRNTR